MSEELKKEDGKKAPEVNAEIVKDKEKSDININKEDEITKKIIFSLCYLFGILFFLPLILYKGDAKATRHANEGLLLLILSVVGNVVFGILTRITGIFGIIAGVYSLLLFILGIVGIVFVVTDQEKELPLIGKIKLLK